MKRNILFVNQATGYLTLDLVNCFADSGQFENTELLAGEINIRPTIPSKRVKVVKTIRYNKKNSFQRISSWIIAFIHILFYVWLKPNSYELFLVTNPPFTVFIPLLSHKKFSLLIYDIYPDTLVSQGIVGQHSWFVKIWKRINVKVFDKADNVFTISEDMKAVISEYVAVEKIKVIYNWGHNEHMKPVSKAENEFIKSHNLDGKFVVLYSGNIGKTHDIDKLVDVAIKVKDDKHFIFILIGEGGKKELIKQRIKEEQLDNFLLLPFQSPDILPHSMGAADVCVVTTDSRQSSLSIPSKTYSFLSVGAAFMCIADKKSELARMVEKEEIGKCFSANETQEMAGFLLMLSDKKSKLIAYKQKARELSYAYTSDNAMLYLKEYLKE